MLTYRHDHWYTRPACVVKIAQAIRQTGGKMEIYQCGPTCHACYTVCGSRSDIFKQAKDKLEFGIPYQSVHKYCFSRARIAEDIAISILQSRLKEQVSTLFRFICRCPHRCSHERFRLLCHASFPSVQNTAF